MSTAYEAEVRVINLHEECFISDEQVDCCEIYQHLIHDHEEESTKSGGRGGGGERDINVFCSCDHAVMNVHCTYQK